MKNRVLSFFVIEAILCIVSCSDPLTEKRGTADSHKWDQCFNDFDWIAFKGIDPINCGKQSDKSNNFAAKYDSAQNLQELFVANATENKDGKLSLKFLHSSVLPVYTGLLYKVERKDTKANEYDTLIRLSSDTVILSKTVNFSHPTGDFARLLTYWIRKDESTIIYEFYSGQVPVSAIDPKSLTSFIDSASRNLLAGDSYKQKRIYRLKKDRIAVDIFDQNHWRNNLGPYETYELECKDQIYFKRILKSFRLSG